MIKHLKRRHVVGVTAALVATLALSGVAFAYWSVGGGGTGSANAATGLDDVTVEQTTVLAPMFPGDGPQTISGHFLNGNAADVYIYSLTVTISSVDLAPGAVGTCDASDFLFGTDTIVIDGVVPSGSSDWTGLTIQFNNKDSLQDGCKGAAVNLAYSITAVP